MRQELTAAEQRARHHGPRGCMTTMSTRHCSGCNKSIPYPHESTKALIDRMAAARDLNNKETAVKTQKIDSTPKPTKKPGTPFHLEAGARQQLLARIAGDVASGVVQEPSEATSTADGIAEISVDIAEAILTKIGL